MMPISVNFFYFLPSLLKPNLCLGRKLKNKNLTLKLAILYLPLGLMKQSPKTMNKNYY